MKLALVFFFLGGEASVDDLTPSRSLGTLSISLAV